MFRSFFVFFILLFSVASLSAQFISFDILLFGDKVGNVVITRKVVDDTIEIYTLDSRSKVNILWLKRENYAHYEVVYHRDKMFSSKSFEIENGKKKRWANLNIVGNKCVVESYKGETVLNEAPKFSVVKLFFENGTNYNRVFYESEGTFAEMTHPKPEESVFTGSDGSKNTYYYQNGKLQQVDFRVSIATVKLVRTN